MAVDKLNSGFDAIRPWRGSVDRGFEELCYQLFKGDAPVGTRPVRTGNPDGGVEWYTVLPDGSEHGWQAKHVHDVDSLLGAMTESVRAVVKDRPNLARLTFLISSNLSAGTSGKRRKSQRQKYNDKVEFWRTKIAGADAIEFVLIQESDILDRLALPEHQGRKWFWWADPELTDGWLAQKLAAQVQVAGEKYRPDLQVDLPIEGDLAALGFDDSALHEVDRLRRAIVSEAADMWLTKKGPGNLIQAYDAILAAAEVLKTAAKSFYFEPSTIESDLLPLRGATEAYDKAIADATDIEHEIEETWRTEHPDQAHYAVQSNTPHEARGSRARRLANGARELVRWFDSTPGRALCSGTYFLEGVAGSGKTHLLLEGTQRALDGGRPAVFLTAAQFGRGDLWASVCDQLGLPTIGSDVLLGAMNAAGEAAGPNGRRFVISVDALNETTDTTFWRTHLPSLRAAVAGWPHVGLAVSCRDTYVRVVCEEEEQSRFVRRSHPGFAGHEVDATQKFFAFHGLQAPRIPLLVPEFSLPLFLKLFCEGLKDSGETAYGGHEGRVAIFQRYLDGKLRRVAERFRPEAASEIERSVALREVTGVLDALLDEMALTGTEGVSLDRAEVLAGEALGSHAAKWPVVLGAMDSEGILNQELLYLSGDSEQGVRVLFQALADYMILRRRLDSSGDPTTDETLHNWLRDQCSWGIVDAAAVALPELYALELPDLVRLDLQHLHEPDRDDREAYRRFHRDKHLLLAVVETLPYRDSAAVTKRTVDLLNESRRFMRSEEVFRIMFLIAPQPGNRLNGDCLHRHLAQLSMPSRDEYFGFPTYHELTDETTAASVLARWASRGPYPDHDSEVIELACIPLMWLLLSPNRYMRDWVTKALVQLLRGHLAAMERLLVRFWPINDPYVVQRVLVIAYGAVMRSDPSQQDEAKKLVATVRKLVFTPPVRPDELMLDAARGIVEWGLANGLAPLTYRKAITRPYGLPKPGPVPSEETLEAKFGWKDGQPDDVRYSTILHSLIGLGDFGRYVVQPGIHTFSRYPLSKPYPESDPAPDPGNQILKGRWTKFEKSLSADQLTQLADFMTENPNGPDVLDTYRTAFFNGLAPEQSRLLHESFRQGRRRRFRDDNYPADRASRWVFVQTLRLGWTPQRFGTEDRRVGLNRSGRDSHKAERWGKKYQWMAYHEILARIADNFHSARQWSDHVDYTSLSQITGDREIDPSLPPVPFHQLLEPESGNDTWRPPPIAVAPWPPVPIDFQRVGGDLLRFINGGISESDLDQVVLLQDIAGTAWVLLDACITECDPKADKSWLGLQQTFYLNSWFVPSGEADALLPRVSSIIRRDHHDLIDSHGHIDCCYVGEVGWTPHDCAHQQLDFSTVGSEVDSFRVAPTVENYCWEGSLQDCSINDTVSASLPSAFIRSRSKLEFDERGPSWTEVGEVAFVNLGHSEEERQRGFLVRGDWLSRFMKDHNLDLVVGASTLRWKLTGDHPHREPPNPAEDSRRDVYSAARIDSNLAIHLGTQIVVHDYDRIEIQAQPD